jgi:hypothetical protein
MDPFLQVATISINNFYGTAQFVPTGLFGGGSTGTNTSVIQYISIASTGNATDFGDLTVARNALAACASSSRGVFAGGH